MTFFSLSDIRGADAENRSSFPGCLALQDEQVEDTRILRLQQTQKRFNHHPGIGLVDLRFFRLHGSSCHRRNGSTVIARNIVRQDLLTLSLGRADSAQQGSPGHSRHVILDIGLRFKMREWFSLIAQVTFPDFANRALTDIHGFDVHSVGMAHSLAYQGQQHVRKRGESDLAILFI